MSDINKIDITSRRDMELYIKKEVSKIGLSNKHKSAISKLVQEGFDIGFELASQGKCEVRITA